MPKKPERSFNYQKRGKETLKERANMKGGNFDSIFKPQFKQWKPKDGKNVIRVLPPTWDDARHYGLDIFVNYSIGPDNQAYLSLSKHNKGDDPLAEARREAQKDGDKELAKALSPSQRILYWIIDRNDEDEGPLLWAAPFTFDKSLSNLCIDEDTKEVIFIDDPVKGRDVRFYREGTGLNTSYEASKMKVLGESPIHEDEGLENEWLDFITDNPLPEVLNFYDYDHIKAQFDGQAGRKDEDEENEDKPTSRGRTARDNDEDDERPVRRGGGNKTSNRTSSRMAVQDDSEPDEAPPRRNTRRPTDEDESDEEAPSVRRRTTQVRPDDDEVPEKPAGRTRSRVVVDEDEDEDLPSTRRTAKSRGEEEEGGGSLRDRLRRRRPSPDDDED